MFVYTGRAFELVIRTSRSITLWLVALSVAAGLLRTWFAGGQELSVGEAQVFERFRNLAANRMGIVISHRFSTVRMADQIVVLEAGAVVEQGTHDELIARGGRYAGLFNLQAAGYR